MVSGSQLQVAKLAQMGPVAQSSAQQRTTAPSGGQQCSAAARVKLLGQAPGSSSRVKLPGQAPGSKPGWSTLEHLVAPNVLLKYVRLKLGE